LPLHRALREPEVRIRPPPAASLVRTLLGARARIAGRRSQHLPHAAPGPRQAYEVDPTIVQARLAGGAATAAHGYEQGSAPSSPPRVLTSSGVAALSRRRDAYAQDGAQGHLSSEGLGGDPKHRGAIRPKPQCKLSRVSQLLTIYTNPPATSNLLRDHARTLGLRRERRQ